MSIKLNSFHKCLLNKVLLFSNQRDKILVYEFVDLIYLFSVVYIIMMNATVQKLIIIYRGEIF